MRRILASPVIARNEVKLTAYAKPPTLLDAPRIRGTLRAALLSALRFIYAPTCVVTVVVSARIATRFLPVKIRADVNCKFELFTSAHEKSIFIRDIGNPETLPKFFGGLLEKLKRFNTFEMTFPTTKYLFLQTTVYRGELTNKNIIPTWTIFKI